jgi:hypothetical protein
MISELSKKVKYFKALALRKRGQIEADLPLSN